MLRQSLRREDYRPSRGSPDRRVALLCRSRRGGDPVKNGPPDQQDPMNDVIIYYRSRPSEPEASEVAMRIQRELVQRPAARGGQAWSSASQ